jgi:hypothetical protein
MSIAWDVMNKIIIPRVEKKNIRMGMTIHSTLDWDKGVALDTEKGIIHVLGTGEVVDDKNVLGYN